MCMSECVFSHVYSLLVSARTLARVLGCPKSHYFIYYGVGTTAVVMNRHDELTNVQTKGRLRIGSKCGTAYRLLANHALALSTDSNQRVDAKPLLERTQGLPAFSERRWLSSSGGRKLESLAHQHAWQVLRAMCSLHETTRVAHTFDHVLCAICFVMAAPLCCQKVSPASFSCALKPSKMPTIFLCAMSSRRALDMEKGHLASLNSIIGNTN